MKCSLRRVSDALHSRGVRFHPMREKPIRTEADERDRLAFAKKYAQKPARFWADSVHAYMDNKSFPVFLNSAGRSWAAKRAARGTYRAKGQGLAQGHVKPRSAQKVNFGKSVMMAVALSAKKVLMCHVVPGKWNASEAAKMYSKSLAPALQDMYPSKRRYQILEDNDPSGYKSKAAIQAKDECKIVPMGFPKRSPDINPLDYGFWSHVNRLLRKQESAFPASKRETRCQFIARVKRTVKRVPASVLTPLVKSMKRRCVALRNAKGKDFEE